MASENLKKFILVLAQTAAQGEISFKDGFQLKDLFDFYPQVLQIPALSFPEMAVEIRNRTEASKKEVLDYIVDTLKLQNAWAEKVVETGFKAIVAVDDFIEVVKSKPPAEV